MTKIVLWALDGGLGSMITGAADVFHVANMLWRIRFPDVRAPLFEWQLASPSRLPVQTAGGLKIAVDAAIDPLLEADILLLPGIVAATTLDIEAALAGNALLIDALRAQRGRHIAIGANCASTFFLAEAGSLEGRHATTSWWLQDAFRARYPSVNLRAGEILTEDDTIMCSGASTACLHLALRIVERFGNAALAVAVGEYLLIDAGRTTQTPFKMLTQQAHLTHHDSVVQRGQRWMEKYLERPFQLSALAQHLQTSERTVIRRFKKITGRTPGKYMQGMKIEFAKRLLETGQLSVDRICLRVGYEDVSSFRNLFRRETGVSPSHYQALLSRTARLQPASKVAA